MFCIFSISLLSPRVTLCIRRRVYTIGLANLAPLSFFFLFDSTALCAMPALPNIVPALLNVMPSPYYIGPTPPNIVPPPPNSDNTSPATFLLPYLVLYLAALALLPTD